MDRRTFAASIALGVLAEPFAARAQRDTKVHRVGYLNLRPGPNAQDEAFVEQLREILPRAKRIAVLALGGLSATPLLLTALRDAGQTMDLELTTQRVTKPEELPGAFTEFQRAGAHALIVQVSPFTLDQRETIVEQAAQHRLPAMYDVRAFVDAGGLVAYGPDLAAMYRRAASYVDRIFKGTKPGDLLIEQPTKFEFVINLKTAKELGLTIPQSL